VTGPEAVDVVVVGGGILGLATARAVRLAAPGTSIVVLEKESTWGAHQSGRNSNVIHSGLYYTPGGLKARLARAGGEEMIRYCQDQGVPVRRTGKLVVATTSAQVRGLDVLAQRGAANGVTVRRLGATEIAEREPNIAGIAALEVAETALTDFGAVCRALAAELRDLGADLRLGSPATGFAAEPGRTVVGAGAGELRARVLVNCAGLHSDRVAEAAGVRPGVRIMPFRGEYYALRGGPRTTVTTPVYPVPDPDLPFLGVHVTPMLDGTVNVGPNAVPALSREGYRRRDAEPGQVARLLTDRALRGLARRHWRHGAAEVARSLLKPLFVREVRRMMPGVEPGDLLRHSCGVRAQAVDDSGTLVDDFVIRTTATGVHVLNAPSPAATSSLLIGRHIARDVVGLLGVPPAPGGVR
jgi:L-2-hydroxyglutarate oxidase